MNRIFKDKELAQKVAGRGNYSQKREYIDNPTPQEVEQFLEYVEAEVREHIENQIDSFGYVLYTDLQIEQLRRELQRKPVYRIVYEVSSEMLPENADNVVEEILFGNVSDREFIRRVNRFIRETGLSQKGVAKMAGFSETHFGEVLRGNRKVSKDFRIKAVNVLSKFGFS